MQRKKHVPRGVSASSARRLAAAEAARALNGTEVLSTDAIGAQLSALIYRDEDDVTAILMSHGFTDVEFVHSRVGVEGVCAQRDDQAYICFRGTKQFIDFVVDAAFFPMYWPMRHVGFGRSWRSVEAKVKTWLSRRQGVTETHVSGHSLGGAIAYIAAFELAETYAISSVTTFGAPATFWCFGASSYAGRTSGPVESEPAVTATLCRPLSACTRRWINGADIVPRLLPVLLGFFHVGRRLSARHPSAPSILDDLMTATSAITNWSVEGEPMSKRVARAALTVFVLVASPIVGAVVLAMIVVSAMRNLLLGGKSHASLKYVHNLGLAALELKVLEEVSTDDGAEEPDSEEVTFLWRGYEQKQRQKLREAKRRERSEVAAATGTSGEYPMLVLVVTAVAIALFIAAGFWRAFFVALALLSAPLLLKLLAWFDRHPDPIGLLIPKSLAAKKKPTMAELNSIPSQKTMAELVSQGSATVSVDELRASLTGPIDRDAAVEFSLDAPVPSVWPNADGPSAGVADVPRVQPIVGLNGIPLVSLPLGFGLEASTIDPTVAGESPDDDQPLDEDT